MVIKNLETSRKMMVCYEINKTKKMIRCVAFKLYGRKGLEREESTTDSENRSKSATKSKGSSAEEPEW